MRRKQVCRLDAALQQRDQALQRAAADVVSARTAAAGAVELAQVRLLRHCESGAGQADKYRLPDTRLASTSPVVFARAYKASHE